MAVAATLGVLAAIALFIGQYWLPPHGGTELEMQSAVGCTVAAGVLWLAMTGAVIYYLESGRTFVTLSTHAISLGRLELPLARLTLEVRPFGTGDALVLRAGTESLSLGARGPLSEECRLGTGPPIDHVHAVLAPVDLADVLRHLHGDPRTSTVHLEPARWLVRGILPVMGQWFAAIAVLSVIGAVAAWLGTNSRGGNLVTCYVAAAVISAGLAATIHKHLLPWVQALVITDEQILLVDGANHRTLVRARLEGIRIERVNYLIVSTHSSGLAPALRLTFPGATKLTLAAPGGPPWPRGPLVGAPRFTVPAGEWPLLLQAIGYRRDS